MDKDATNKVIVVTGGADGLGYAIAESFLIEQAKHVILVDLNEAKGNEAADKLNQTYGAGKADFIQGDVYKDLNDVSAKIFDKYKTVDCLVNNAGILNEYKPRQVIEVNVISLIEWTMKFLEHMRKDKGGKGGTIINMGSIYSVTVDPYLAVYKAAKFAVYGFSRSLGHEQNYKMYGVRVLVICPSVTHTNMTRNWNCLEEQTKELHEFLETLGWQSSADVGTAAVKIYKSAESGTGWTVIGGDIQLVP